ncbi:MAG TPA: hypothetical protein VKF39_06000 [Nitrososphaerales archaeon]|nr:hypothetical protein [Nitrososphaerales archaeon]
MEYKLVYRAYSHKELTGGFRMIIHEESFEDTKEAQSVNEAEDWSRTLNTLAKERFIVKNSGALQLSDNIVFWALLGRP